MPHWAHSAPHYELDCTHKPEIVRQHSSVRIYCSDAGYNSRLMSQSFQLCGCFSELCWKCQIYNKLLCKTWWAVLWLCYESHYYKNHSRLQWTVQCFALPIKFQLLRNISSHMQGALIRSLCTKRTAPAVFLWACVALTALSGCWHHQSPLRFFKAHWTIGCLDNRLLFPNKNLKFKCWINT